jgi:thiosulfate reductase cytochrome b subunit
MMTKPRRLRWRGWPASSWAACVGLGLGLLAVGPGLAPGYLLSYDMVFVPSPPISAALLGLTGGPPRAVPSDAVVAVLSLAVPADIVQKMILILIFVLACSGAAALLTSGWERARGENPPLVAALAAGVFYAWNPFVAERLLIGQWALLLGYAGLPWVVRSLCTGRSRIAMAPLCAALLPAAVGGFAAMAVSALAAVPAAWFGGERSMRVRRLVTVLAILAVFSLPWLIPALLVTVHTDPRGVDAFAARADTPFGRVGSLLMLSGIWNAQTVPRGYGGAPSVVWLLVVLAAVCGYLLAARPLRLCPGLGIAGIAGLVVAAIGVTSASRAALLDLVRVWPGFAVLRDGQQYVAPLALAEAVGLGGGVARVLRGVKAGPAGLGATPSTARAAAALGVMAVLAPVLLLPGMAWGSAGRLKPVEYPADWMRARQIIDSDPRAGTVLLLPWAAYRRYRWNGGETVFDPWSRLAAREVISNTALQVGSQTLAPESADSIRLNRIVMAPGPMTRALLTAGVEYVIVDAGPLLTRPPHDLAGQARLPGASLVLASRDLVVFRLPISAKERR